MPRNEPIPKKESFSWIGDVQTVPGVQNLIRGEALHPIKTVHPEEWPGVRVYLEEELEKAAHTLAGKPLLLDHSMLINGEVTGAEYEDGAIEYVAKVGDPRILDLIKNGAIKHCSVEFNWKSLEQVNGIAPRGLNFTGLSLLKNFDPGDPLSTVELVEVWEGIVKQLKEAKNVYCSGHAKDILGKEQAEPQEFILYVIRDPAAFLEERFSTVWIDLESGIQGLYGRLREEPENPQPMALLFMKAKSWTLEKMQGWLQDHSQYLRQSQPAATAPAGIQSVSSTPSIAQGVESMDKKELEKLVEAKVKAVLKEQQNQEPEKDEHGCLIGKERFDEEQDKCVAISTEARVTFLETSLKLKEQALSKEEIEAKIDELTKKRQDLENELRQIAEEEQPRRDEIWQQIDLITAELQAFEQALAALVAGLTQPAGEGKAKEAEWTPEYISNLPDSAFAVIASGGEKDDEGKTVPRDLRKLPHHNAEGNLDLPHLRAALARMNQIEGASQADAKKHLCGHARGEKAEDLVSEFCGEEGQGEESCSHPPLKGKEQGNDEEPEKDEHGCLIGKERYEEDTDKCVPITAEARIAFLEAKLKLKEQEGELSVDEIKQKIADLTKQREELDQKLYPESPLSEEEQTAIRAQLEQLWAEIEAYEQALAAKIAGQAAPPETPSGATERPIESKKKGLGEALIPPTTSEKPEDLISRKEVLALLPERIPRHWGYGPHRVIMNLKRKLKED